MHDHPGPAAHVLPFGDFEVDPRSGDLRSAAGRVTLPQQPLQILLALLEQPGELISRDHLRHRLWPNDTFVDFEHGLNAAVKRLRDALGDSADVPRYIETIPRRGYRLIAPVPRPPEAPATNSGGAAPAATKHSSRWARLAAMAAICGAVAAILVWIAVRKATTAKSDTTPVPRAITRLTFGEGLQTDVTWSPDGTRIAYASDRGGNLDIWVQALDGSDPIAVAASPFPESQPAWSPRGDQIVFRSERDDGGLFSVAATGGPARRIATFGFNPAWRPDGSEVFFTSSDLPGTVQRTLHSVVPDGSSAPRQHLADFLQAGAWAAVRPRNDGRMMVIGQHRTDGFGIYAVGLDGRVVDVSRPPASLKAELGLDEGRPTLGGQWNADGSALYLEVTPRELATLWRVPATNYALRWEGAERLTSGPGNAMAIALSPDGSQLAFTNESRQTRAWVFPFDPVAGKITGAGRPVTPDDITIGNLRLLPDGRSILFTAARQGRSQMDVMVTEVDTGTTRLVAPNARGAAISPDGQSFTYRLTRPRRGTETGPRVPELEFAAAVRDPSGSERLVSDWSAGQLVVLGDWLPDGSAALASYWKPFPRGPVALVFWPLASGAETHPRRVLLADPTRAFWQASLSPDQRHVSFVAARMDEPGHLDLGVMPLDDSAGRWRRLATDHRWADKPRWAPDGRTIYFISGKPSGYYNLWGIRVDPVSAEPTSEPFRISAFDTPAMAIEPNMALSDMSIAANRLAVTMRRASGSIWTLSVADR